jgi:acyl-CoA dehydrogenase
MTEPDTGSDVQAIRTRARPTEGGYRIDGAKTFITNGSVADLVIVAASTHPEDRGRGLSLFLLDTKHLAGFAVTRVLNKIGQHESDTAELFFDDVRVPASALLGAEGDGWRMLMEQLPRERLAVGVTAVAAMRRALSLATQYANERTSFGQRLIQHQHVRFELAECATLVHIAETFLDDCIVKLLDGDLDTTTVSMAKLWLTDTECQVVDRCLQIFGGYGYITEFPIADLYRNARAQRIYGGTNEIMKEVIGRSLIARDSRSAR